MRKDTGPWAYEPRKRHDARLDLFHVFATAAAAILVAWIIGSMTTAAMTEIAAETLRQQMDAN